MIDKIEAAKREFDHDADAVGDERALESFRVKFLSRNGIISKLFDEMKAAPNEEKPALGKALNQFRKGAEEKFTALEEKLQSDGEEDAVDLSLPGEPAFVGGKHILTQTIDSIKDIFKRMGFSVYEGPELESDYHNFEALNFPPDHPARDEQDTYFVNDKFLLRTHTSPVQIRLMQSTKPPVRAIMPGKVYRNEAINARSMNHFYQVEGLHVDTDVTFADLKSALMRFAAEFYGENSRYRFRASFFPFTEPSAEMDISCFLCGGEGCRVCKHTGWLEILGCGMVDPNVLKAVGYDPDVYSGYAFGMGVDRTALMRYAVPDIRVLYENDIRFLRQF
ncbi:MAG: phenylalanine--tRNA ligase subunit alpha [Ignavibacteriales bacterium]|nr:phenylalanine--tRNA ligase subunit alpha [Ignavibacteriales bacterium]